MRDRITTTVILSRSYSITLHRLYDVGRGFNWRHLSVCLSVAITDLHSDLSRGRHCSGHDATKCLPIVSIYRPTCLFYSNSNSPLHCMVS